MSIEPDSSNKETVAGGAATGDQPVESTSVERDSEGWAVSTKTGNKSPISESTPKLLAMLAHALLHLGFNRISLAARQRMISIFGMVALLTPLALWVSWTKTMLLLITAIGVLSVLCLIIIVWLSPEDEL